MSAVPAPLVISSRLMAALRIEGVGTLHLEATGYSADHRVKTHCVIERGDSEPGRKVLYEGVGPMSGCGDEIDYLALMRSLLNFLIGEAEAYRSTMGAHEPNDGWLFNALVGEWAYMHDSELTSAWLEMGGAA